MKQDLLPFHENTWFRGPKILSFLSVANLVLEHKLFSDSFSARGTHIKALEGYRQDSSTARIGCARPHGGRATTVTKPWKRPCKPGSADPNGVSGGRAGISANASVTGH